MENKNTILLIVVVLAVGLVLGSLTGEATRKKSSRGGGSGGGSSTTSVFTTTTTTTTIAQILVRDGEFLGQEGAFPRGDRSCVNNNPNDIDCWKWQIGELYSGFNGIDSNGNPVTGTVGNINKGETSNKGATIQIFNDITLDDDKDIPPGIGSPLTTTPRCINLPNNKASICLDGLNVQDNVDYNTYDIKYDNAKDLSNGGTPSQTSEPVIEIDALEGLDNGLVIRGWNFLDLGRGITYHTDSEYTDKIFLHLNDTSPTFIDIFYEDVDNKIQWAGSLAPFARNMSRANMSISFGEINYRNTSGNNIRLVLQKNNFNDGSNPDYPFSAQNYPDGYKLIFDVNDETGSQSRNVADDLMLAFKNSTTGFSGFGNTAELSEASEFVWGWASNGWSSQRIIGTKDEDHRTMYGIIIRAPDFSLSSDTLSLDIPADQVKVTVSVAGCGRTSGQNICGGELAYVPLNSTITGIGRLASQLEDDDLFGFQDSIILFNGKYYDIHDELDIGRIPSIGGAPPIMGTGPIIVTSLSSGDDDYETGIFMEIPRRTITYSYLFDELIPINSTSSLNPLKINMLGKNMTITAIASDTSFVNTCYNC